MGRYYWGDIEGKFWFAVQRSDDAIHFKPADNMYSYNWIGRCGCEFEDVQEARKHTMKDCERADELYDLTDFPFWDPKNRGGRQPDYPLQKDEYDTDGIRFTFEAGELDYVNEILKEIEDSFDPAEKEYFAEWTRFEEDYDRLQKAELPTLALEGVWQNWRKDWFIRNNKIPPDFDKFETLLARHALGSKIAVCLMEKGRCQFDCEC